MIVDTFTFFNELDVLEIRLNELDDVVDYFVLVEANKTQSLKPKPFYFEENQGRFEKFLHKIIHVKVEETPVFNDVWGMDIYQRDCIAFGLEKINIQDKDIVLISDVDEIPKKSALLENLPKLQNIFVFGMSYNVYYLNLVMVDKCWHGTVAVYGGSVKNNSIHRLIKLRDQINDNRLLKNAGWHCGYQGGKEIVFKKYFSCVEPFDKNSIPTLDLFNQVFDERIKDGGSFIFCDDLSKTHLKLKEISINDLPNILIENPEKYQELLWKKK